jgi:hypothetical protein
MAAMEQQHGEKVWNWWQATQVFGQAPVTSFKLTLSAVLHVSNYVCATGAWYQRDSIAPGKRPCQHSRDTPLPHPLSSPGFGHQIELIAKLEAYDCLQSLDAIVQAADGIMVARGDLGAQVTGLLCGCR